MTHAAAALGAESLAAHQLALTLFFTLSPLLEVLSQTSQAISDRPLDAPPPPLLPSP